MNKKLFIFFLPIIVVLIFIVFFSFRQKELSTALNSSVVLKVAGDNNFPPYEYMDERGIYTGFNVDIMRAIALSTGIDIQFYPMSWAEACEKLLNGEVDVIEGMKYTKDRDKSYDFSREYLENSQSIFVLSETESINKFEDLKNRTVAIQQGDVAVSNLKALDNVNIIYTTDQGEALEKLIKGEVDSYIGNTFTGVYLINKINAKDRIKIVGKTLNPTKYSLAVKDGDKETLNIINKGLKQIKNNGTYDKIYRKWFGQPVNFPSWYINRVLIISSGIILLFFILALIFYRWNTILKNEVYKRTRELNMANEILMERNQQIEEDRDFRERLLNNIFSGVVTIDSTGIITFSNSIANEMLNISSSNIIGTNYKDTPLKDIFSFDKLPRDYGEKELIIEDKKVVVHYRIDFMRSTGTRLEEGLVIFRDITEEKLMQENIRTKDKLQSLGTLVGGIAHEIRNPLTAIKTYSELIPKKFDNPKFRETVAKDIPLEIDRLNSLINDLLEYSRPRKPFKENINLYSAVNGVILLLNNKIKVQNIRLENNINKYLFISIDKNHFRQVMINVILNAVESMDKDDKKISIFAEAHKDFTLLAIEDNGCGMNEDTLTKVFNPFYTTKPSGTGLGLFVCYQLISENGAHVKVDSREGKGTRFIIKFSRPEDDLNAQTFSC